SPSKAAPRSPPCAPRTPRSPDPHLPSPSAAAGRMRTSPGRCEPSPPRPAAWCCSGSGEQTSSLTAGLLGSPGGRVLVIAVGLAVAVIGGYHIYKGASRRFEDELRPTADHKIGAAVTATGMIGYIAKGVALLVVGVLFG